MNAVTVSVRDPDDQARLDFVLGLRRRWAIELYPRLNQAAEHAGTAGTPAIEQTAVYRWFGWTERNSQKMLWRAVIDTVRRSSTKIPTGPPHAVGTLALDPNLLPPAYYTEYDIHLQPGGLWQGDEAALVYELGAKLVMMGENDDYAFHDLFAATAVPERAYGRIVDLGCGFGKSTRPFATRWPQAEVLGVDLSSPTLRLAHAQAEAKELPIHFIQADAAATGIERGSADLVTATMLVHELPPPAIAEVLHEADRLLAPAGVLRVLDFHLTGDPVRDQAMRDHGTRNNEPYMPLLFDTDVLSLCADAGLVDAKWVAFDERAAGRLPDLTWPERAEWHFPWAVLEASKPS